MKKAASAKSINLEIIDPGGYEIVANTLDLRKDLHTFTAYIRDRVVKRTFRENIIPKDHARRIAKLLSHPEGVNEVNARGESKWLNFIDNLAFNMGFTTYDTKGEYERRGSSEPSFRDNYMDFVPEVYDRFMMKSLQKQEETVFHLMVNDFDECWNEFFQLSYWSRLTPFLRRGCATGVLPFLEFDHARMVLFNCLKSCEAGVWYSVSSLIRYLKKTHPYFLIPKSPKYKSNYDRKGGRYGNFKEGDNRWYGDDIISEQSEDAFERVEGRFVERFFEYIPMTLGYLDLAYGEPLNPGVFPSYGALKGFKVNDLFLKFMAKSISEPRVTMLPNHEIHVESDMFPSRMIEQLSGFADLVSIDKICIFALKKQKAIEYMAENDSIDLKAFLEKLSETPLPANIGTELDEWAGHSDSFTLYRGFGLLEGTGFPDFVDDFTEKKLSKNIRLVRSPVKLHDELETAIQAPILLSHPAEKIKPPPAGAASVCIRKVKQQQKPAQKKPAVLKRKTSVTLFFETTEMLDAFVKAMIEQQCPVEIDKTNRSATYMAVNREKTNAALKNLKKTWRIKIEDIQP